MTEDNVIFIGDKPFMNYVTAVVMQFTSKNATEVKIRARGKFITRAVDVAEISTKRFLDGSVKTQSVNIDSTEFVNQDEKQVRVSIIEIILEKNK